MRGKPNSELSLIAAHLGPGIVIVLGICIIFFGVYQIFPGLMLLKNGMVTHATVIDSSTNAVGKKSVKLAYSIADGVHHTMQRSGDFSSAEKIEILYDPSNPQDAEINDYSAILSPVILPSLIGAVLLGVGIGLLKILRAEFLSR